MLFFSFFLNRKPHFIWKKNLFLNFLRNWAKEEGTVGFSQMTKDELEELWEESQPERPRKKGIIRKKVPVLNTFMTNVLSKNIVEIVGTSVNKAIEWVDRLKKAKLKLKGKVKEKVKEKLLELNSKI